MTIIQQKLFELEDKKLGDFQAKLTPGISREKFIGIRVPVIRNLAKELWKDDSMKDEIDRFFNELPHKYFDENMLHGLLISEIKEFDSFLSEAQKFFPFIDNWAVCDSMRPKSFKKNKERLLEKIKEWIKSPETYTCRFGIEALMTHFLDDDFKPEYLKMVSSVKSEEYYINMMIAWYFATALAKQWDATIPFVEKKCLSDWTHNKTIQKAIESYRITDEQKKYLRTLKV